MKDSRFFEGYTWVSDDESCKTGLCMPTTDPHEAAEMFLRNEMRYYNKGKCRTVYTLASADAEPMRHDIVL